MKKIVLFLFLSAMLCACEGSDTYQGKWKAMNADGEKFEITFGPKDFTIKDSLGSESRHMYSQNSVQIENSVSTYGINVDGNGKYQIRFPKEDEKMGFILDENGAQMFTIGRGNYVTYDEIYKLN